ncbi:MAG: winged helix-turn-helix transcriptional regulator [Candidatus Thorarchaeota archaeon]
MDLLDKKILTELTKNCRMTYQELSDKVGYTPNAIRKRVDKLIENGTLYSFTLRPTLNSMNANIALTLIETDGSESPNEFIDSLGTNEMVGEVNPIVTKDHGFYLVLSDYVGANGIFDLGGFFRRLDNVITVEMHPVMTQPIYHGRKVEFQPLELSVMKHLYADARMSIRNLTEIANMSARRIRKILLNLQESGGISFSIRWNTAAAGSIRFFLAFRYDVKTLELQKVISWLEENYEREFWLYWISTSEPLVFASFTVESIAQARRISIDVRAESPFSSVRTWICYPPRKFKTYPETWFEKLLFKE